MNKGDSIDRASGAQCVLEYDEDLRNKPRELMHRWDNRITLETLSIPKYYRKGRLALILELESDGLITHMHYSVLGDGKRAIGHSSRVLPSDVDPRGDMVHVSDSNCRHQEHVFIQNVQTVQCKEDLIPSRVRVWSYHVSKQRNDIARVPQYSLTERVYKFIPVLEELELSPVSGSTSSEFHDFVVGDVQSGSEIVNSVSDEQRHNAGNLFGGLKLKDLSSGIRIFLEFRTANILLKEGIDSIVKINDVLIGPFDL